MNEAPHALIAGAGIGGLTAALCLARAGFRVTLLERAARLEEAGAGLQLSPNASAILRDLGVLPRLASAALAPEAIHIRRARDGRTLQRLPLNDAERRWGAPYLLAHRADLQRALVETVAQQASIALDLDTEVAGFATDPHGVELVARHGLAHNGLADNSLTHISYRGACLIGADGLRSFVRGRLADVRPGIAAAPALPATARYVAWRGLIDASAVPAALRRAESALWLGPGAHLVHYPLRGGSVINLVAVVDDRVAIDWNADLWSQPGAPEEIQARFSTWHKEARLLIGAARSWRKWPLVSLDPLPQWAAGPVALLGDAAHPMLPFLAQGAAQAIEDAAMLGAMLSPEAPIEPCLAAYAAARRPRANRVQAASRRQGPIYHLGPPANFFRDFALRKAGAREVLSQYDWLYRVRPAVR